MLILALLACNGTTTDDTGAPIDTANPLDGPADADNDGFDERDDCDDNDPNVHPGAPIVLADGIDQDCDGQDELPIEILQYSGAATVAGTSYTGSTTLLDYPELTPDTELCRMAWPVASSTASTVDCEGCTWAFELTHGEATTRTGDFCDRWYTDSSWDTGPEDFTIALHPAWTGTDGSETAREAVLLLIEPPDATPYWWAPPASEATVSWDETSGQLEWSIAVGKYYYYPG